MYPSFFLFGLPYQENLCPRGDSFPREGVEMRAVLRPVFRQDNPSWLPQTGVFEPEPPPRVATAKRLSYLYS